MATVKRKNAGKSMFLKEYLVDHPDAGNERTISTSLIGKFRRDLELTGQGTAEAKSRATA